MNATVTGLPVPQLCERLGEVLKIERLNKNKSQEEVAGECQCSIVTIQKIEAGNMGVAIAYILRYIEAVSAYHIIKGIDDIRQHPAILKPGMVKYNQRPQRKNKKSRL